jgi:hypothetical protein
MDRVLRKSGTCSLLDLPNKCGKRSLLIVFLTRQRGVVGECFMNPGTCSLLDLLNKCGKSSLLIVFRGREVW